jgi:DNA invertase Pin-like site-specific DNA recombinase
MSTQGRKLDAVLVDQVKGFLNNGIPVAEICRAMCLARPTVAKIKKQYEEEKHGASVSD